MDEFLSFKEESERRLRNKCFNAGLNERDTEMCIDYFIKRLSHKEISLKYDIEPESSSNKKSKLKKLLFNDKAV